jgi:hypothetical protein
MAQVPFGPSLADAKTKRAQAKAALDYVLGLLHNAKKPVVDPLPDGNFAIVSLNADGSDFIETDAIGPNTLIEDGVNPPAPTPPHSDPNGPPATNG